MEAFGIEAETSHVQRKTFSMNTSKISHSHLNEAFRNCKKGRVSVLIAAQGCGEAYVRPKVPEKAETTAVHQNVRPKCPN